LRDLYAGADERIRRIDLMPGLVAMPLRLGRGLPWERQVENFDRMALVLEVLEGAVELHDGRDAHRFEAGGAYLLGCGVGNAVLKLHRERGVELYALFVADFFLEAYAAEDTALQALKKEVAHCRGITLFATLGSAVSPYRLARLSEPSMWEAPAGLTGLGETLSWLGERLRAWQSGRGERYRQLVEAACDAALSALPKVLSLQELADACGVGEGALKRAFREAVGEPPARHLRRLRLQKAYELLRQGRGVAEAAGACGFVHTGHFALLFQERFGILPSRVSEI
jgi:AraC-like DNA-binding protein